MITINRGGTTSSGSSGGDSTIDNNDGGSSSSIIYLENKAPGVNSSSIVFDNIATIASDSGFLLSDFYKIEFRIKNIQMNVGDIADRLQMRINDHSGTNYFVDVSGSGIGTGDGVGSSETKSTIAAGEGSGGGPDSSFCNLTIINPGNSSDAIKWTSN